MLALATSICINDHAFSCFGIQHYVADNPLGPLGPLLQQLAGCKDISEFYMNTTEIGFVGGLFQIECKVGSKQFLSYKKSSGGTV